MFICLAITCLLVGLLYVYVRQQLKYQNDQLEQLMGMVKCMVVPQEIPRLEPPRLPTKVVVSDDESEDESDESDDESDESSNGSIESVVADVVADVADVKAEITEVNDVAEDITELSTSDMVSTYEEKGVRMEEMADMLNIIGIDISSMVRPVDLETLSVKELRAKVAEVGGPTLKTKREMIQYLSR